MTTEQLVIVSVSMMLALILVLLLLAAFHIIDKQEKTIRELKHQRRHDRETFIDLYNFINSDPYISEAADKWGKEN